MSIEEIDIPAGVSPQRARMSPELVAFNQAAGAGKAIVLEVPSGLTLYAYRNRINSSLSRAAAKRGKKLVTRTIDGKLVCWAEQRAQE